MYTYSGGAQPKQTCSGPIDTHGLILTVSAHVLTTTPCAVGHVVDGCCTSFGLVLLTF